MTDIIEDIQPAGGGDHTTLNDWVSDFATRDLVTNTERRIARCHGGGNLVSGDLSIPSTITTNDLYYPMIIAADGQHTNGAPWDSNKPRMEFTSGSEAAPIDVGCDDFRCYGIQIRTTKDSGRLFLFDSTDANGHFFVEECLLVSDGAKGVSFPFAYLLNNPGTGGCGGNGPNGANRFVNNVMLWKTPGSDTQDEGVPIFARGDQTVLVALYNTLIVDISDSVGAFVFGATDSPTVLSDNNYCHFNASSGQIWGGAFDPGDFDAASNTEPATTDLRSIAYDSSNFVNPTIVHTTFDVNLPKGSALINRGLPYASVVNDVRGRAR